MADIILGFTDIIFLFHYFFCTIGDMCFILKPKDNRRSTGVGRRQSISSLTYRKLRNMNLAVLSCSSARKAAIGEHLPAGVARFFAQAWNTVRFAGRCAETPYSPHNGSNAGRSSFLLVLFFESKEKDSIQRVQPVFIPWDIVAKQPRRFVVLVCAES